MTLFEFEHQVKLHKDRVYGFAFHYLGNREEAEDVTQEVFIRLWKHRENIDEEKPLGWLLRVTRNASVDAIRRRKTYQNSVSVNTELLDFAQGQNPLPDSDAEASDFRQHLLKAVEELAEPYRSIVILREIQELKYQEICDSLDLPLSTVKVYLHRARKILRNQLQEVLQRENE